LPRARGAQPMMRERTAGGPGGFARYRPRQRRAGNNPEGVAAISPTGFYFDSSRHDFSGKTFLGHTIDGAGMSEGERALDILARSPATAHHLSYQLAQYFVADDPPPALVDRMAARYLATDGEIRQVLATMFSSAEFWERRNYRAKFKTPYEYVISAARATGVQVRNCRPLYGTMALLGMPLYGCQTPNGYANTRQAWLNPDAMMTRVSFATAIGTGHLPLNHPPFRENDERGGETTMRREPKIAGKHALKPQMRLGETAARGAPAMTPPDAAALAATLGGALSPSTAAALEDAPMQLRSALILGSPDFMMR
jgi:hypothetical protein